MKNAYTCYRIILFLSSIALRLGAAKAQCPTPQLYDLTLDNASASPTWVNCIDNTTDPDQFTLPLISPNDIQNYTIDFGDGSPIDSGALWPANTPVNHTFGLGIYTVTVTETRNGCTTTITGQLINDRKAGASALPPTLGSSGCVPHSLTFINQTTNTSQYTQFEWDWGDGTTELVDYTTAGQPISHTYVRGKAGCNMQVTLYAYSLCDTTFSTYGPFDFWDVDTTVVTASATQICGGQTITFQDQSLYNCNVKQPRMIRWDFTEVGGALTSWLPAIPSNRSQDFFVSGNVGDQFTVFLEDSNYCGVRSGSVTIEIIGPPQAAINVPTPTVCAGQTVTFNNQSTGSADIYYWNWGDGAPVYSLGTTADVSHKYSTAGNYNVTLVAAVSGTDLCRDTAVAAIQILPSSVSDFSLDKTEGCAPVTVSITENSQNANSWNWDFGSLGTYNGQNPAPLTITTPGTYQVKLTTSNSLGCGNSKTATVTVYPSVTVNAVVDSVCIGHTINFTDKSVVNTTTSCATGSILYERWNGISGTQVSDFTSSAKFDSAPDVSSLLTTFEGPTNVADNYGDRIRGFICPPQTGNYVFWIASDDNSELWLSTDANPVNKVLIASVSGYTNSEQWTKYLSQQSVPVFLQAGQRYYIESLHKEGGGSDNIAVGWKLPSGTLERPIPGSRLAPYSTGSTLESWKWDFGDGDISAAQNPAYTYPAPGDYEVKLTVSTGKCASTDSFNVQIFPGTQAGFSVRDTAACTPLSDVFVNLSTGASKLVWNFGDGTVGESYVQGQKDTVSHVFVNNTGVKQTYYISLISETNKGCADTLIKPVTVFSGPKADFSFSPSVPKCSPVDVTFTNLSSSANNYEWYFGTYDSSSTSSASFNYHFVNNSGAIRYDTIRLNAFSNSGCYGTMSQVVTIFPKPDFTISTVPDTGCNPVVVKFSTDENLSGYLWGFGDGNASTSAAPQHTFYNTTSTDSVYTTTLAGTTLFGCKDTLQTDILVHPSATADFVPNVTSGCSPLTIHFQNLSSGQSLNVWDFDDGTIDSLTTLPEAHTFINTSTSTKVFQVKLSVFTSSGCSDSTIVPITVYPSVKAMFSMDTDSGCSPVVTTFSNNSQGTGSYVWDFGDGYSTTSIAPVHSYTNSSSSDTTFDVSLQITSTDGCTDTSQSTVTVYPVPVADFSSDLTSGCAPLTVHFNDLSTGKDHEVWDFGDSTIDSTLGDKAHIFSNNTSTTKTFTVNLVSSNSQGCKASKSSDIRVFPAVKAAFSTSSQKGCTPLNVNFTNTSTGATTFMWNFGDASASASASPGHTFMNTLGADTTYNVDLLVTSGDGCRDSAQTTVTVYPLPTADFSVDLTSGCSPLTIHFDDLSAGTDTEVWDFGDAQVDSIGGNQVHTYENFSSGNEVWPVVLHVANSQGCKASKTMNITVFPVVKAAFSESNTEGCSPLNVNFANTSTGAATYTWNFGDTQASSDFSPQHTFLNTSMKDTVFKVILQAVSQDGCSDSAFLPVAVYPVPQADFTTDMSSGCSPLTVHFSNLSTLVDSLLWSFGDGEISFGDSSAYTHVFLNESGSQRVFTSIMTVESSHGCSAQKKQAITVYPSVSAYFLASDTTGCSPMMVKFTNLSYGGSYYNWNFGDGGGSTGKTAMHSFFNSTESDTSYSVMLTVTSSYNCQASYVQPILIHPVPKANFTAAPSSGCSPLQVSFGNQSLSSVQSVWNFGGTDTTIADSTFVTQFVNQTEQTKTVHVSLKVLDAQGCSDTVGKNVAIYPEVKAGFTSSDTSGCSPWDVSFYNLSAGTDSYFWDFGDGIQSVSENAKHTFQDASPEKDTLFHVKLVVSNSYSCSDTIQKQILVFAKPKADFLSNLPAGCAPLPVTFTNASKGGSTYIWDFVNSTDTVNVLSFTHNFDNSGTNVETQHVALTAISTHQCTSSISKSLQIYPKVIAGFQSDPSGCSPFRVKLNNTTVGGSAYKWDLGDGNVSVDKDPIHTYSNITGKDSTFNIRLVATSSYGCSDTLESLVTVFSKPKALFSVDPAVIQLPDSTVNFVNSSSPGDWNFTWDFGDGQTSSQRDPLVHYYDFYGTYKAMLTVQGANCLDSISHIITVKPTQPVAAFSGSAEGCVPVTVSFVNQSKYADHFHWEFGDGDTSDLKNPMHVYDQDGTFTVTLRAIGEGGTDSIFKQDIVIVHPIPIAFFKVKNRIVKIPGNAHYFSNSSQGATRYLWDFGDGSTSSEQNPQHMYAQPGTYDVTLVATNQFGCSSTYKEVGAAVAEKGGRILVPDAFTPAQGGNPSSLFKNDYFNPVMDGATEFHMQIFNRWGELIYETFDVNGQGWDGTYRGQPCQQDVYVYKIKVHFVDGSSDEKVGDVTLIR